AYRYLERLEGDWLDTPLFVGPVALLRGVVAGEMEAEETMRAAWQDARMVCERRLANDPAAADAMIALAQVQALVGDTTAAEAALRRYDDSVSGREAAPERERVIVWTVLGYYDDEIDVIVARFRE